MVTQITLAGYGLEDRTGEPQVPDSEKKSGDGAPGGRTGSVPVPGQIGDGDGDGPPARTGHTAPRAGGGRQPGARGVRALEAAHCQ